MLTAMRSPGSPLLLPRALICSGASSPTLASPPRCVACAHCRHRIPFAHPPGQDLLLHLELPLEHAERRGEFGAERYEVPAFQLAVKAKFAELYATLACTAPVVVDVTGLSIEDLGARLETLALAALASDERRSATRVLW